jgi:hypothetical protein
LCTFAVIIPLYPAVAKPLPIYPSDDLKSPIVHKDNPNYISNLQIQSEDNSVHHTRHLLYG